MSGAPRRRIATCAQLALLALLALFALSTGSARRAHAEATAAAGAPRAAFDHLEHARAVAEQSAPRHAPLACARCHPTSKSGEPRPPDHATCYGKCHGAAPTKKEAAQAFRVPLEAEAVSRPSAAPGAASAPPAAPASTPPGATAASLPAELSPRARTCLSCHAADDLRAGRFARPAPPPSARLTVATAFSHQRHQRLGALVPAEPASAGARTLRAGAACLTCHRGLVEIAPSAPSPPIAPTIPPATPPATPAATPPATPTAPTAPRPAASAGATLPTAATCATAACHDGEASFAITERCTQCHREAPTAFYAVPRPTQRFVHRQHQAAIAATGCQGCHRVAPGSVLVEGVGHAACASCHAEDFGAAQPVICGACHSSTEPWRTLRADRLPADATEFGARLDHATHPQPCQRCHTLDTAARQLRPSRDHASCTGAGCHQLGDGLGAAPRLSECTSCHVQDLVATRAAQRRRAAWSVRQRFDHTRHRNDKEGAPAACASCHVALGGALSAMPAPPKRTCEPCHDGKTAFSVTGVGCNRCHGGVR